MVPSAFIPYPVKDTHGCYQRNDYGTASEELLSLRQVALGFFSLRLPSDEARSLYLSAVNSFSGVDVKGVHMPTI